MLCVNVLGDQLVVEGVSNVCAHYALVTSTEFTSATDLIQVLNTLFMFDPELFAVVEGGMIMGFLASHFSGRIVRWLGKS